MAGKTMALQSCHVDSHSGMRLSHYPTNHPNIDDTGCTEEKERVDSWGRPKETTTWEQGDRDNLRNPPTLRNSHRPASSTTKNADEPRLPWQRQHPKL